LGVPCEYQAYSAAALSWVLFCAICAFIGFLFMSLWNHSTYQPGDSPIKKK
jgi:hypothetical protein